MAMPTALHYLYLLILETKVFSGLEPSEPPPDFEKF
jgi:hypothetical protein